MPRLFDALRPKADATPPADPETVKTEPDDEEPDETTDEGDAPDPAAVPTEAQRVASLSAREAAVEAHEKRMQAAADAETEAGIVAAFDAASADGKITAPMRAVFEPLAVSAALSGSTVPTGAEGETEGVSVLAALGSAFDATASLVPMGEQAPAAKSAPAPGATELSVTSEQITATANHLKTTDLGTVMAHIQKHGPYVEAGSDTASAS